MPPINSAKKAAQMISEAVSSSKVTRTASDIALSAREMEMVPKYLELASLKGTDRFSKEQISSITSHFRVYKTNLSKTDLLKDLLAIGAEKGTPLSAEEFAGFLNATSSMKQLEQRNVLKFLKAAKEKEGVKLTPESIKKAFPYEDFKVRQIKSYEGTDWLKRYPDFFEDKQVRERYETAVSNEMRIASNRYYQQSRTNTLTPAQYITRNSKEFVETVAKVRDPEGFLSLIEETGVTSNVLASADALTDALKLSSGNISLVNDLVKSFYPPEIKQIVETLFKEVKMGKGPDLKFYIGHYFEGYNSGTSLKSQRKRILKDLELEDKINLLPLKTKYYEDVFPSPMQEGRGKLLSDGNFERGKKK